MHVLYFSQYFPPEVGATQNRAQEMIRGLIQAGHRVTAVAEAPNHPAGVIWPEYRGKWWAWGELEGARVLRVWVKTSPEKNFRTRMAFYLSYMVNAAAAGLLLRGPFDVVYATSPPLFVGGAALAVSALRGLPLVFEVRDLWPESAAALGELTSPRAIAWATRLEEACYRRARAVVVVSAGAERRLLERGLPPGKLARIPNGSNTDLFTFRPEERARRRAELGLNEKFVLVYAGIFGIAQGLETVVEAARLLAADFPNAHFLLIGDGPEREKIAARCAELALPNVTLIPARPRESIPGYLSAADAALVPLKKVDLFAGVLPSKLFDAWACERPVVLAVQGEAARLLEAAGGGVSVPPEDPAALAAAVRQLFADPAGRAEMGRRARAFTAAHYSRQAQAQQLARLLEQAALRQHP